MAGHSKWANIKHRKAAQDAKKGKVFTKIAKELTVAARLGGGDPEMNPRLRVALEKGRAANMPKDNVIRAINKGTGEGDDSIYYEINYDGYGPGGVAILIQTLTDNKNRTVSEVRNVLSKRGGNIGEAGSVSWIFEKKGIINIKQESVDEDTLMMVAIDSGAEDINTEDDNYEVVCEPKEYWAVRAALEENKIPFEFADVTMKAKNTVPINAVDARKLMTLIDYLEDLDDVQEVYANFDIDDETMAELNE